MACKPYYLYKRNRCILVTAALKDNVNISKVKEEYMPILDEFAKDLPANIKMVRNFDQAEMVSQRLGHLGFDFVGRSAWLSSHCCLWDSGPPLL